MPRSIDPSEIDACLLRLVRERAPRSICPSEVARALAADDFRPLMPLVRSAVARLVRRGDVRVTQRGEEVDIAFVRGPVRIVAR